MVPLAPTPVDNGTEECDPVLPPGPEPAGSFEKSSFIEDRNRSSEVSAGPGDQLSSDESVHAALMKLQVAQQLVNYRQEELDQLRRQIEAALEDLTHAQPSLQSSDIMSICAVAHAMSTHAGDAINTLGNTRCSGGAGGIPFAGGKEAEPHTPCSPVAPNHRTQPDGRRGGFHSMSMDATASISGSGVARNTANLAARGSWHAGDATPTRSPDSSLPRRVVTPPPGFRAPRLEGGSGEAPNSTPFDRVPADTRSAPEWTSSQTHEADVPDAW